MSDAGRLLGRELLDELESAGLDPRTEAAGVIYEASRRAIDGEDVAIRYVRSEWLDAWCYVLGDGVRAEVIRREILGQRLALAGMPRADDVLRDAARLVAVWCEERSVLGVAQRLRCSQGRARRALAAIGVAIAPRGRPRLQEAA